MDDWSLTEKEIAFFNNDECRRYFENHPRKIKILYNSYLKEDIKTLKKKLIEDISSEKLKLITKRDITANDVGFFFSNLYHIIDKRFGGLE